MNQWQVAGADIAAHSLDDHWYRDRSADLEKITVPVLSAANWAHALHTRGNFVAFTVYLFSGSASHATGGREFPLGKPILHA